MKTDNLFESTFLEQYIMTTPNYPDHYPINYEEVILKFPCFLHEAPQYLGMESRVNNRGTCHTHICSI